MTLLYAATALSIALSLACLVTATRLRNERRCVVVLSRRCCSCCSSARNEGTDRLWLA